MSVPSIERVALVRTKSSPARPALGDGLAEAAPEGAALGEAVPESLAVGEAEVLGVEGLEGAQAVSRAAAAMRERRRKGISS
jgi:hypothetical protein